MLLVVQMKLQRLQARAQRPEAGDGPLVKDCAAYGMRVHPEPEHLGGDGHRLGRGVGEAEPPRIEHNACIDEGRHLPVNRQAEVSHHVVDELHGGTRLWVDIDRASEARIRWVMVNISHPLKRGQEVLDGPQSVQVRHIHHHRRLGRKPRFEGIGALDGLNARQESVRRIGRGIGDDHTAGTAKLPAARRDRQGGGQSIPVSVGVGCGEERLVGLKKGA